MFNLKNLTPSELRETLVSHLGRLTNNNLARDTPIGQLLRSCLALQLQVDALARQMQRQHRPVAGAVNFDLGLTNVNSAEVSLFLTEPDDDVEDTPVEVQLPATRKLEYYYTWTGIEGTPTEAQNWAMDVQVLALAREMSYNYTKSSQVQPGQLTDFTQFYEPRSLRELGTRLMDMNTFRSAVPLSVIFYVQHGWNEALNLSQAILGPDVQVKLHAAEVQG